MFNGKELDYETGLYYYGARYYDPKVSLWLNTDPLSGYNPIQEVEHYIDGQHNGGVFNPMNHNTYGYTYNNPILYVDPNGKQNVSGYLTGKILTNPQDGYSHFTKSAIHILNRVSGVDKSLLYGARVTHSRKENLYLPYYDKFDSSSMGV